MPITLSQLKRNQRTISVPLGEDASLSVTYRPWGFTPATEDRLRELAAEQRGGAALVSLLLDVLVGWDLLGDDGEPLPISVKTLNKLPIWALSQIVQAIASDLAPNPPSAGLSGVGLPQKEGWENRPTGIC